MDVILKNINKIDLEVIKEVVDKDKGLLKITTETYYQPYTANVEEIKRLAKEWFEEYGNSSFHAYRDGSRIPLVNLVKVEIIE